MKQEEVALAITSEPANNLDEVFLECHKNKVIKSTEKLNNGTLV